MKTTITPPAWHAPSRLHVVTGCVPPCQNTNLIGRVVYPVMIGSTPQLLSIDDGMEYDPDAFTTEPVPTGSTITIEV